MKKLILLVNILLPLHIYANSISYLNHIRQAVGLIPLKENRYLGDAAKKHSQYLLINSLNSHYEKKQKGFYATTPSLRAIKSGYSSRYIKENIATNVKNDKEAIDILFSAIYHRFVFLSFDIDEIGVGVSMSSKKKNIKNVYVYDLGLSNIAQLCKNEYLTLDGISYIKDLCRDSTKYIPESEYQKAQHQVEIKNSKIIMYPPKGAKNILPAFFNENPNPMPGYKVSGYPISVSLNPVYFDNIRLKKFRLYNSKNRMIRAKLFKSTNDFNHKLRDYEFTIIPIHRLDYDSDYIAYFEAITNQGKVKLKWSFHTRSFKEQVYTIARNYTKLMVNEDSIILYIKPKNRKDIIKKVKFSGDIKLDFIDGNTVKVSNIHSLSTIYIDDKKIKVSRSY
jgi:hypothetical protein